MRLESFLLNLINLPSLTGSEQELAAYLADFLSSQGLITKLFPVDGTRANLFASFAASPSVLLSTHLDTVPPFIPARQEADRIFGRGACDAKGIIAAMIFAALVLDKSRQQQTGLLFVVGEETDSIGAKAALQQCAPVRYVVNGEPTGNQFVHAQKGTFIFRLSATGKAAHSGYPEHGDSALHRLLAQLSVLRTLDWGSSPSLGEASFNLGKISGGEAANTIAASAQAECCLRVVTSCAAAEAQLRQNLMPNIDCKILTCSDPVKLFVPAGSSSVAVSFGSDAVYLAQLGTTLMIGPGDILQAHTPEESIAVAELYHAVEIYRRLLENLCTT